jgi:hypothetical protein
LVGIIAPLHVVHVFSIRPAITAIKEFVTNATVTTGLAGGGVVEDAGTFFDKSRFADAQMASICQKKQHPRQLTQIEAIVTSSVHPRRASLSPWMARFGISARANPHPDRWR